MTSEAGSAVRLADTFSAAMATVARRLPAPLSRAVPASLLGFAVINGFTFAVDLVLLTLFRSVLGWALWLSITMAYCCAFGLSYLLNRTMNFRSHSPVGPQLAVYVAVVVVNYLIWILGVGAGLGALGVQYHLARIVAGLCEALFMYCCLRWLVFRDISRPTRKVNAR